MSMPQSPGGPLPGQGTSGLTDVVTQLAGIVRQLSALVTAFSGRLITGTFTLAASATTTVAQPSIQANSVIGTPTPLNASAATLMGSSKSLYISAINPGVGFTVATADGTSAAGTEKFQYQFTTPS